MKSVRKIDKVWKSKPTIEGAGVHLKRAFGYYQVPLFDPFLMLDDFHSNRPQDYLKGFPWHPHRGIETITYVIHGRVEHGDSMGNKGDIAPGDVQWMSGEIRMADRHLSTNLCCIIIVMLVPPMGPASAETGLSCSAPPYALNRA